MPALGVIFKAQRGNSTAFYCIVLFECSIFDTGRLSYTTWSQSVCLSGSLSVCLRRCDVGREGRSVSAVVRRDTFCCRGVMTKFKLSTPDLFSWLDRNDVNEMNDDFMYLMTKPVFMKHD